jgi:hypothetical protein
LYGSFEIARSVASRALNPFWWIGLIADILLILLAFWVSGSDRVYALRQRAYLIPFWVGFMALFKGSRKSSWPSESATPASTPTILRPATVGVSVADQGWRQVSLRGIDRGSAPRPGKRPKQN